MIIKSLQSNWENLSHFFQYSGEIRRLIYYAIQKITEKWTAPLQNWVLTISQLHVYCEGRLQRGSLFNRRHS